MDFGDWLILCGLLVFAAGLWMMYPPLAVLFLGAALVLVGWAIR